MTLPRPALQSSEELFGAPSQPSPEDEESLIKRIAEYLKEKGVDAVDWAKENPKTAAGVGAGAAGLLLSPTVRAAALPAGAAALLGYGAYKYGPQAYEYAKENPKTAAGIGVGAAAVLSPTVRAALASVAPAAGLVGAGYGAYKAAPWVYNNVIKPAGQKIADIFRSEPETEEEAQARQAKEDAKFEQELADIMNGGGRNIGERAVDFAKENPKTTAAGGVGAAALISPTVRAALASIAPAAGILGAGYGLYKAAPWLKEHVYDPAAGWIGEQFAEKTDAEGNPTSNVSERMDKIFSAVEKYEKFHNSGAAQTVTRQAGAVNVPYQAATGLDLQGMLRYIDTGGM